MNHSSKPTLWNRAVSLLSGEFMLEGRANGGSIIFARAIMVTLLTYGSAVLLKEICTPERLWSTSWSAVGRAVSETIPWFGAIFAGVYAALYARFASQWSYIAGLYNQIKATEVQLATTANRDCATEAMAQWKAGFIEDADALHLSSKPMIAGILKAWLPDPLVQEQIATHTPDGEALVTRLCTQTESLGQACLQRLLVVTSRLKLHDDACCSRAHAVARFTRLLLERPLQQPAFDCRNLSENQTAR